MSPLSEIRNLDRCLDMLVGAPPPKTYTAAQLARDPALRREVNRQAIAQKEADERRNETLDRWGDHLKRTGYDYSQLPASDVSHLCRTDLENIRAKGGDYIRIMVEERAREKSRLRHQGRERER